MNRLKEIQTLHNKGFVILRAQRTNNAPIGWKRKDGKWGYVEEMSDANLVRYKATFDATILTKSHCGFYLGFNNLCCIDLDTKKTDAKIVKELVDKIIKKCGAYVCIETTKSNGYHIFFRFKTTLPNEPNWTQLDAKTKNWIEVYYSKRFIAAYISNSKKYSLIHGDVLSLSEINAKQYKTLIDFLGGFYGKRPKIKRSKPVVIDDDILRRTASFVEQIEAKGLDITGDNPRWFRIGKAFASAFGEKGFDLFNRISRFSPLYNEDTIQYDYNNFVIGEGRDRKDKISIATFFHLCEEAGLLSIEALNAQKLHPTLLDKEFTVTLSSKQNMAEHIHIVAETFKQHVNICCVDQRNFFVFDTTHWYQKTSTEVIDIYKNFISRCEVEPKVLSKLYTVPYLRLFLEEVQLTTQRTALEPHTGDLHEGIYINLENGVLHINMQNGKRKLLDHEAKYNFTTLLPYAYDPTARCLKFDTWIDTQIPDKSLHVAYYAFVASCLTKHKADIIMLLAGETSTGKSSLIDITRRVIGIDNSVAVSAGILFSGKPDAQTQAMQMENKLLAYDFDSQPFKHLEMLLKVAAQEPLPGWQMHVTRRPVINYGRLIIGMNPYNYSVFNAAVARRFITINMNVPVVKDNTVMPEIYENELAGIFNHIINIGIKHLLENKGTIKVSDTMRKATLDFHTSQRDAVRWFNTYYTTLNKPDDKNNKKTMQKKLQEMYPQVDVAFETVSNLYAKFRAWLEDSEGYHISKLPLRKHFAADLELLGVKDDRIKIDGNINVGLYLGIKKGL